MSSCVASLLKANAGFFLTFGFLSPVKSKAIWEEINRLCAELRPHSEAIVNVRALLFVCRCRIVSDAAFNLRRVLGFPMTCSRRRLPATGSLHSRGERAHSLLCSSKMKLNGCRPNIPGYEDKNPNWVDLG